MQDKMRHDQLYWSNNNESKKQLLSAKSVEDANVLFCYDAYWAHKPIATGHTQEFGMWWFTTWCAVWFSMVSEHFKNENETQQDTTARQEPSNWQIDFEKEVSGWHGREGGLSWCWWRLHTLLPTMIQIWVKAKRVILFALEKQQLLTFPGSHLVKGSYQVQNGFDADQENWHKI